MVLKGAKSIGHPRVKVISSCELLNMDVEKQIHVINKSSKYMFSAAQSYLQCLILYVQNISGFFVHSRRMESSEEAIQIHLGKKG